MNLAAYFSGSFKALSRSEDWPKYFDLSRKGFTQSFVALFLTLPCYYVCALGVDTERAILMEGGAPLVPFLPFVIIFTLYAFAFSVSVYLISMVFDKQDRFRPWVIVRHWTVFFTVLLAAALFGLYLVGILPFAVANFAAFTLYMSTLIIDIRYAQKIGEFEWGAAVLTGCIITAMGFTILLTGLAQFSQ